MAALDDPGYTLDTFSTPRKNLAEAFVIGSGANCFEQLIADLQLPARSLPPSYSTENFLSQSPCLTDLQKQQSA